MRLIHARTFTMEEFYEASTPPYAILSHTWEREEVSFTDMKDISQAERKRGFTKIRYACNQAMRQHLEYVWVDTCCIDKSSSAELQEAINSMYRWYSNAAICYAYMEDILGSCPPYPKWAEEDDDTFWERAFQRSRWFTRGWTLQELVAPDEVVFYGYQWNYLCSRSQCPGRISQAANVPSEILSKSVEVNSVSVAQRMSWASGRATSRAEDEAYCLLGILNVNMPMLYGEGTNAFRRLQEAIMRISCDQTILAWDRHGKSLNGSLLAASAADFVSANEIVQVGRPQSFELTNQGLRISLLMAPSLESPSNWLAVLNCRYNDDPNSRIALRLRKYATRGGEYHAIVSEDKTDAANGDTCLPSRLETLHMTALRHAEVRTVTITNNFEQSMDELKFMLILHGEGEQVKPRLLKIYPRRNWDDKEAIMRVTEESCVRGGVLVEFPVGAVFNVAFGFDTAEKMVRRVTAQRILNEWQKKLVPGIWATAYLPEHKGRDLEDDVYNDYRPCEHSWRSRCSYFKSDSCDRMPSFASATGPDGLVVTATISSKLIHGEVIFFVDIRTASEVEGLFEIELVRV